MAIGGFGRPFRVLREETPQLGPWPLMWKGHDDVDRVVSFEWLIDRLNELQTIPADPAFVLVQYPDGHRCYRACLQGNPNWGRVQ